MALLERVVSFISNLRLGRTQACDRKELCLCSIPRMARFERITFNPATWDETLAPFPDRIVFQSAAWLSFVAETQRGEVVVAALREGNEVLGYFSGVIVRKFGLKILGSPFRAWSTPYIGFNLKLGVPRRLAAEAISEFAFKQLGCLHMEVVDAHLTDADVAGLGFAPQPCGTMEIDLTQDEEALLNGMTKSCRWTVRKAEKNGVVVEEAKDAAFADDYYNQLKDVFAKQGSVPHIPADRTRALVKHLLPTGNLLMLRARDPEGHCIGTGLFPALNQAAFYWGGASWRQYQKLYPNELLQWHAIRHLKQRGIRKYNMVGTMDFKQKFGGQQTSVPMLVRSKYRWLAQARAIAPRVARAGLQVVWKVKALGRRKSQPEGAETDA